MAVDYEDWLQWALWPLDVAVLLLHGIDPDSEQGELLKKLCKSNTKPRPKIAREVKATFHKADSAIRGGKLSYHSGRGVELEPLVLLQWAKSKDLALPEKLDNFLSLHSENTDPQLEKPLTESERNSLLKMILGMATAKYGYDSKNPRNLATGEHKYDSIHADLEKQELNVSSDTIRKYLKEASDKFGKPIG
jgi:hypothetical protein